MGSKLSSTMKANTQQIQEETKEAAVVLYTKAGCGYCTMAKNLLDGERVPYKENDLGRVEDRLGPGRYQEYVNALVYSTHRTSVPQIFICGSFIGGYTELEKLHKAGKLWRAVETCSHLYEQIT